MIVATAGHVDHGKTSLVKALTGIDADRLPEEKKRGMTIDLGFAYLPVEGGQTIGFVDVPGHERFIHNMLAGVSGMDCALLVVAADDGPMPQTREHLAILELLGVRIGAVALTKIDRVEANRVAAAEQEIAAMFADADVPPAPVFALSAMSGEGMEALRGHLFGLCSDLQQRSTAGLFRMTVDRSFTLAGAGLVVTGTVLAGEVCVGDQVEVLLAGAGARVVGTATTAEGARSIDAAFAQAGLSGRGVQLDVNDGTAVDALLESIASAEGGVSILVNNAGITRDNLLMRMSEDEWDSIIDTNLKSVWRLSRAVLRPMMKARRGRIVNIGSVVGSIGNAGQVNYAASKAGMLGFTRALAREVGSRNITVNCVAPGFIDTDMTRALKPEQKTALLGQVPLGRLGEASDVAAAVLFLASPAAGYVTGSTLHVNGGLFMD